MKQSSGQINVCYFSVKNDSFLHVRIYFCELRSMHSLFMVMLRHHRHFPHLPDLIYSRISSQSHHKILSGPNVNQIQQHDSALIALLTPR
jgi:hypothetical protein